MTPAQILELRALADAATPGPWFVQADRHRVCGIIGPKMAAYDDEPEQEWREVQIVETDGGHYPPRWNDAAFVTAARSAVPALLDRVAELEAGLREAVNLASTNGVFCDPFTSGCDNPECKRLDALAALVTK